MVACTPGVPRCRLQLPLAFIESADVAASLAQPGAPSTSSNAASITSGAGSGTALAAPPPLVVDYEPMPPPSTSEVGRPILAFPESTASLLEVIERDINRTFPSHGLFAEVRIGL